MARVFFLKKPLSTHQFEILKDDPNDVIFAKKLNNSGGKFFYCKNEKNIKKILEKLLNHLEIKKLYCIYENLKKKISDLNISFQIDNNQECQGIITTCEHFIADQGKVLLSSEQIKNKNPNDFPNELIIISYTSQIVQRINDAMRSITKKYGKKIPSNITTIGNSIKKLNVIIIEDFKT